MVSESFAALLLLEPNSLLVIMGPFPGVSHGGNSVWPKPRTHFSQTAPGKAAGRGWWLSLCAGALPSLTAVTLMWHPCGTQWPLDRLRGPRITDWCDTDVTHPCGSVPEPDSDSWTGWGGPWHWSCFLPLSFCYRNKELWGGVVQPCGSTGSGLPNKCWRLKQALNYQLLLNFGTSAITSSRQRKLWSEFSVFSSFLFEGVLPYMEVSQF